MKMGWLPDQSNAVLKRVLDFAQNSFMYTCNVLDWKLSADMQLYAKSMSQRHALTHLVLGMCYHGNVGLQACKLLQVSLLPGTS